MNSILHPMIPRAARTLPVPDTNLPAFGAEARP